MSQSHVPYRLGESPTYGVPAGIRTPDTRLRRPLLYPTELQIHIGAENEIRTRDPRLGKAMLYH